MWVVQFSVGTLYHCHRLYYLISTNYINYLRFVSLCYTEAPPHATNCAMHCENMDNVIRQEEAAFSSHVELFATKFALHYKNTTVF